MLEGFRSYEKRTEFDFSTRNFIAIVGPTGAGKSTILDGIAYALYGRTPRVKSSLKRLICTRSDAAKVRLGFQSDGRGYEITRALPRSGSGEHLLVDASSGEKTIGADAVTAKVEELLRLDFDAFCSSVLLAQGKFARFLEAATTERMKILKGVFRFDQIDELRTAAKARIAELELELRGVEGERRGIPDDAPEQLMEAKALAKEMSARAEALGRAVPEEKQLEEALRSAAEEAARAQQELDDMRHTLEEIPVHADLERLAAEEDENGARLAAASKELEAAKKAATAAVNARSALEKKLGTEASLAGARARAEERARLIAELEESARQLGELEGLVTELADRLDAATTAEAAESAAVEEARAGVRAAREAHSAHALRGTLVAGEPCPVCEQEVEKVPKGKRPTALRTTEAVEAKAIAAHEKAVAALQKVQTEVATCTARAEGVAEDRARCADRVEELDSQLAELLGKAKDPVVEIEARREHLERASDDEAAALDAQEDARTTLEDHTATEADLRRRRQRIAAALIGVAGRSNLAAPDIDDGARALVEHAVAARSTLTSRMGDAEAAREKAGVAVDEARAALAKLRARLELSEGTTVEAARADAQTEAAVAERKATELAELLERDKELRARADELTARQGVFGELAGDLTDRYFVNFLLEDRRRLLSELASERLRAMTGRYRFDDDANFAIVDELAAETKRDVVTLSGGETFLASLALALGLAEAVGRHGGRLQCFFLDEGFGSLDPEAFDLALDGIEKLVTPDRFIGLVSHVHALSARVEDKIELEKGADGTTVVKAGGA